MRLSTVLDAVAVSTPLGLAIGRVGCLCEGCCHGTSASLPWGVVYPKIVSVDGDAVGTPAYLAHLRDGLIPFTADQSVAVHPVQLYEALGMCIVFLVLLHLWKGERLTGRLAPLFIVLYCGLRFALEFIRVQEPVLWGLTLAQLLSLAMTGGAVLWLALGKKARAMQARGTEELPVSVRSSRD